MCSNNGYDAKLTGIDGCVKTKITDLENCRCDILIARFECQFAYRNANRLMWARRELFAIDKINKTKNRSWLRTNHVQSVWCLEIDWSYVDATMENARQNQNETETMATAKRTVEGRTVQRKRNQNAHINDLGRGLQEAATTKPQRNVCIKSTASEKKTVFYCCDWITVRFFKKLIILHIVFIVKRVASLQLALKRYKLMHVFLFLFFFFGFTIPYNGFIQQLFERFICTIIW